jgi:hypothetical protein
VKHGSPTVRPSPGKRKQSNHDGKPKGEHKTQQKYAHIRGGIDVNVDVGVDINVM